MIARPSTRIVHLHIPKTAGTALRQAFEVVYGDNLRSFPHRDERQYRDFDIHDYDFYSGHFGYKTASQLQGDIVTVFRNPVDRFVSVYYFWRQLYSRGIEKTRNTYLADRYSLDEFVLLRDEPFLLEEFYNRITWQVAYGGSLALRQEFRNQCKTEDDVFKAACENLQTFSAVGLQERLGDFAHKLKHQFGVEIKIPVSNVTENKVEKSELRVQTLRRIQEWLYMDLELYQFVLQL